METILIVDVDPHRADLICKMLNDCSVTAERYGNIHEIREAIDSTNRPAVIVLHCALIENSFTEVAKLRNHPNVQLVFYCTDAGQKSPGVVTQLPENLTEILLRITEKRRLLPIAS